MFVVTVMAILYSQNNCLEGQKEGITIQHTAEPLNVMVDTERSRDHVVRMLNKLVRVHYSFSAMGVTRSQYQQQETDIRYKFYLHDVPSS